MNPFQLNKEQQNILENKLIHIRKMLKIKSLTYKDQSKKNGNDLTLYSPRYFDFNTTILPYTTTNIPLSLHMNNFSQPIYSTHTILDSSFNSSQEQLIYNYPPFLNNLEQFTYNNNNTAELPNAYSFNQTSPNNIFF
ncbi:unnamed protein product [Rhizophagus irregularis]|nr:unnamed protein product [Rhizophagus irregularis]CAB4445414.1 unnamed protein product [Rhizophagus irregularis]